MRAAPVPAPSAAPPPPAAPDPGPPAAEPLAAGPAQPAPLPLSGGDFEAKVESLLAAARGGDGRGSEDVFAMLYDTLRSFARTAMRRQSRSHTLQPTALVNETFLRLVRRDGGWEGRRHFLGVAARAMRSVLVDHARHRTRQKRRPAGSRVPEDALLSWGRTIDLIALDDALRRLAVVDELSARIVELRYFGDLALPDVAEILEVPLRTVERRWTWARAWLRAELT